MKKRGICLLLALVLCLSVLPARAGAEEADLDTVWNSLKNSRLVCSSPVCHPTAAITLVLPDGLTMDTLTALGIRFYWWHGKGGQQAAHDSFTYTPTDEDAGYAVRVIFLHTREDGYDDYLTTAASLTVEPGRLVTWVAGNGDEPVTELLPLGTTLTARTPEKPGYFFVGWYTDEALTEPWSFRTGKLTRDITLYARWFDQSTARTTPLDLTGARVSFTYRNGYPGSFDPAVGGISVLDNAEGWGWDASTKTLTLQGANIDSTVTLPGGAALELAGENTVTVTPTGDGANLDAVRATGSLTVRGDGKLNIVQRSTEIAPGQQIRALALDAGTLTVQNAALDIQLGAAARSIGIAAKALRTENAELQIRSGNADSLSAGIVFTDSAALVSSDVTICAGDASGKSVGILSESGKSADLTLTGGHLDVRSGYADTARAIDLSGALRATIGSGAELLASNYSIEQPAITAATGVSGFVFGDGVDAEKSTAQAVYASKDFDMILTLTAQEKSSGSSGGSKSQPVVKIPISSGGVRDDLSGTIGGGKLTVTPVGDITLKGDDVNIGTRFTGDYDTTVLPKDFVSQLPGKDSLTVDGQNGTLAMNGDVLDRLQNAPLDIIFKNDADSRADATPAQKKALESIGAAAADVGLRQNGSDVELGDLKIDAGTLKFGNINADSLNIGNANSGDLNLGNTDLGGFNLGIFDPGKLIGVAREDDPNLNGNLPLLVISPRLLQEQKAQLIGGAKGLYIAPDGSTQDVPLFSNSLGELSLLTTHLSLYAIVPAECEHDAACPVAAFRDLDADAWYHDGVHACAALGLMHGVGDRTFQPDGTLTRAQFVTMLWRLAGEAGVNGDEIHEFSDVGSGGYYAAAVQWAVVNGIATGTSATTFSPDAPITREQMAAMLFRYAVYDGLAAVTLSENLSSFPDVQQLSAWAVPAMQWAVGAGIITGTPDGSLAPQAPATRAQAAAIVARYLKK